MFDGEAGCDPYVFYKMGHISRARKAWLLSADLGLYEAMREGPGEFCPKFGEKVLALKQLLVYNLD